MRGAIPEQAVPGEALGARLPPSKQAPQPITWADSGRGGER
jgi:hypothetical protein